MIAGSLGGLILGLSVCFTKYFVGNNQVGILTAPLA